LHSCSADAVARGDTAILGDGVLANNIDVGAAAGGSLAITSGSSAHLYAERGGESIQWYDIQVCIYAQQFHCHASSWSHSPTAGGASWKTIHKPWPRRKQKAFSRLPTECSGLSVGDGPASQATWGCDGDPSFGDLLHSLVRSPPAGGIRILGGSRHHMVGGAAVLADVCGMVPPLAPTRCNSLGPHVSYMLCMSLGRTAGVVGSC
jgi:hypothetical protein